MQITAIGTIWRCEENPNYEEGVTEPYTVDLVEYLPGYPGDKGSRGQAIKLTLDSSEYLEEGMTYRVTARVTTMLPTREDDDLAVLGVLIEAKQID